MKKISFIIRIVVLVLCGAVFLVSAGMLVKIMIGYRSADKTYEEINQGFETLERAEETESSETEEENEDHEEVYVIYRTDMTE